jgi:branched-chain amino acid aminotransferase
MAERIWINGEVRDAGEPVLSPGAGWLMGRGLFETMLGREGQPAYLDRHMQRLRAGAAKLSLTVPEESTIRAALRVLMRENQCEAGLARLRLTVVPGTVLVAAVPFVPYLGSVAVVTSPFVRNERSALAGIKAISYAENLIALEEAKSRGAGEAILANTVGDLCEAATSNIFLVEEGRIVTPPLSSGCLPGVMREVVLEACGRAGLKAAEERRPIDVLSTCREAFLTSSLRGVQSIGSIDGRPLETASDAIRRLREAIPF